MNLSVLLVPVSLAASVLCLATQDTKPAPAPANPAVVPVPRSDAGIQERQAEVLRRAKTSAATPVIFIGDSITQGWEGGGREIWQEHFAGLGALNLGVSGDRTEHVLWRLQQAPITRLEPKVVVLLIGTNNLGHGTSNAEQTLAGVLAVIAQLHAQVPKAVLLVHEIFPRGERMNAMRGDIAQVNQVLRNQSDPRTRVLGFSDSWVGIDGTISKEIMPDFLHLSQAGYAQWAEAIGSEIQAALK
jgi:lysophospholipase L1-like esterase